MPREIKEDPRYDITDRAPHRVYKHHDFSGHQEAYFGTGMEFDCSPFASNLYAPFSGEGTKLLLSHEWPYYFDEITYRFPDAWIQLIHRNNEASPTVVVRSRRFYNNLSNYDWYENPRCYV